MSVSCCSYVSGRFLECIKRGIFFFFKSHCLEVFISLKNEPVHECPWSPLSSQCWANSWLLYEGKGGQFPCFSPSLNTLWHSWSLSYYQVPAGCDIILTPSSLLTVLVLRVSARASSCLKVSATQCGDEDNIQCPLGRTLKARYMGRATAMADSVDFVRGGSHEKSWLYIFF